MVHANAPCVVGLSVVEEPTGVVCINYVSILWWTALKHQTRYKVFYQVSRCACGFHPG